MPPAFALGVLLPSILPRRHVVFCDLDLPSWEDIAGREYDEWDVDHIVIDTAGESPHESMVKLEAALALS